MVKMSEDNPRKDVQPTWPEKMVASILEHNELKYIREYEILDKFYDFYLLDKNILIEVHGVYWHAKEVERPKLWQVKNKINDAIKRAFAKGKNIPMLTIWEDCISEVDIIAAIKELESATEWKHIELNI